MELQPVQRPAKTWAGHGSGATCSVCGNAVTREEIEYEVELPPGALAKSLRFHFACYQRWAADSASARATATATKA